MKHIRVVICSAFLLCTLSGCDLAGNILKYRSICVDFMNHLIARQYDECISSMALENEAFKNANTNTLKLQLDNLRGIIVQGFTVKLNYSFVKAEKKYSSRKGASTPPNATRVLIQFDNNREFGVMEFVLDDVSGKVLGAHMLNVKQPIPNLTGFWLFALLPLLVFIFNLYAIVKIWRSTVVKNGKNTC